MARGKGGLGRGLDSLFEDAAPVFESEHAAVETLPLMTDNGVPATAHREEKDGYIEYTVRIPTAAAEK